MNEGVCEWCGHRAKEMTEFARTSADGERRTYRVGRCCEPWARVTLESIGYRAGERAAR